MQTPLPRTGTPYMTRHERGGTKMIRRDPVRPYLTLSRQDRNAYVWEVDEETGKFKPMLVLLRLTRAATCVKWRRAPPSPFVWRPGGFDGLSRPARRPWRNGISIGTPASISGFHSVSYGSRRVTQPGGEQVRDRLRREARLHLHLQPGLRCAPVFQRPCRATATLFPTLREVKRTLIFCVTRDTPVVISKRTRADNSIHPTHLDRIRPRGWAHAQALCLRIPIGDCRG